MSNPFGADMLISEIIPPILIGSGANKFNPGSSDTDSNMDVLYLLEVQTGLNTTTKQELILESQKLPLQLLKLVLLLVVVLPMQMFPLSGGTITNLQSCNSAWKYIC